MLNPIVAEIIDWIVRLTRRHGCVVYDACGRGHDWGQALIRTQLGDRWMEEDQEGLPNEETMRLAAAWEAGDWPSWVSRTGNQPWQEPPPAPYVAVDDQ